MTDIQAVLLGGIGAAVTWGGADYFAAHASKKLGPILSAAVDNVLGAVLFSVIYIVFFSRGVYPALTASGMLYAVTAGAFLACALAVFYRSLQIGPVSIVSPLGSLYPLVTTLIAVAVFGTKLSALQLFGIVMILGGVLVASGIITASKVERKLHDGPKYALLAALFWGISFSFQAQAIARLGWQVTTLVSYLSLTIVFVAMTPFVKGSEVFSKQLLLSAAKSKYIIGATLLGMIGFLVFNFGIAHDVTSGAVVAALSATYPIITVFLALKHMKEAVQLMPLIGAFVGIAGVILLTIG